MWNEYNCVVLWTFFGIALLWNWNENWPFPVLWPLLRFPNLWYIECSILIASSFRIWNSLARIPSPPPALFIVCFLRPTWLHTPGCLALGEWSHHRAHLGCEELFCTVLCILATVFFLRLGRIYFKKVGTSVDQLSQIRGNLLLAIFGPFQSW